jgi:hypothetical protein
VVRLYVEGGGDSKELHARCREGFRKLLEACGFRGRMPRIVACGGRSAAFSDFKTALNNAGDTVFLLIDSEWPVADVERTRAHLHARDNWQIPNGASDEHFLFMTTCMETWIVADREALRAHFGQGLREAELPPLLDLESRERHAVQRSLEAATRNCGEVYRKGRVSFALLGSLQPDRLASHLPSFRRARRILDAMLR